MRFADALAASIKKNPAPLEQLKRDPATRAIALRIEEHAYGRASKVHKVTRRRKRK